MKIKMEQNRTELENFCDEEYDKYFILHNKHL